MTTQSPTLRSILVPLDGSIFAEQAVPLASRITQQAGGKLRLALVHQSPPPPVDAGSARLFTSIELATRKSERDYLRGIRARLREGGAPLSSAVTLNGSTGPALVQYVREMGIDLVVMATHGRGGIRRAWLGSVADHLIHQLEIPVLVVRPREGAGAPEAEIAHGEIMVALDGSSLAEQALGPAAALARLWDTELTVVQVVRPVLLASDLALPIPSSYDEELTGLTRAEAQDYLDDIVARLRREGVRASAAAVIGWSTAGTILDLARPERVAVVVVATHGRSGMPRLALGSVADKIVRAADVPVLVCRPRMPTPAKTPRARSRTRTRRRVGAN